MYRVSLKHPKALWLTLISLAGLAIITTLTNPVDNIIFTVMFFVLILVFMISTGILIISGQKAVVTASDRVRIIAVSLVILTLMMFRSAQSLNWVDAVILILICFGLGFYVSRRA